MLKIWRKKAISFTKLKIIRRHWVNMLVCISSPKVFCRLARGQILATNKFKAWYQWDVGAKNKKNWLMKSQKSVFSCRPRHFWTNRPAFSCLKTIKNPRKKQLNRSSCKNLSRLFIGERVPRQPFRIIRGHVPTWKMQLIWTQQTQTICRVNWLDLRAWPRQRIRQARTNWESRCKDFWAEILKNQPKHKNKHRKRPKRQKRNNEC